MKRTVTMNWHTQVDDDDDDDDFYDSSEVTSNDGSDESDEEFADTTEDEFVTFKSSNNNPQSMFGDFNSWMTDPGDLKDRRKKLLQGMGLGSNKSFMKLASSKINRKVSKKVDPKSIPVSDSGVPTAKLKEKTKTTSEAKVEPVAQAQAQEKPQTQVADSPAHVETELVISAPLMLVRSRSDGDLDPYSIHTKKRKEELAGPDTKPNLKRSSSEILTPSIGICQFVRVEQQRREIKDGKIVNNEELGAFYLIKNMDTGGTFIVKESWNKLRDLQTGKKISIEEFEKANGNSSGVKELMAGKSNEDARKAAANPNVNFFGKGVKFSMKQGANLLKNIKGVANTMTGFIGDKDMNSPSVQHPNDASEWVKVRQQGKSYKELTGLHLCQEIQAHEGPIWTIKFSLDGKYLASAGEDKVIHIWEVQECDVMMAKPPDESSSSSAGSAPTGNADKPPIADTTPAAAEKKKKKTTNKKKNTGVPDYVNVPETVFGLSEKPFCTLKGHTEDILDLSWSDKEQLLSSSMDKTVRLWSMETKDCLKTFAHSDYVTCVQFNPINDDYFISGSLDAKVRIWKISARKVVDWNDINEMVTAVCFTPNAEKAIVGSHKGNVRLYATTDSKLEQKEMFEVRLRKNAPPKKITGFQYAPSSSSDVLLSCADSRIRIMEGANIVQKLGGFKNLNSQIAASFTPDGKYVISASEDSNVYMWKRVEPKNPGASKPKTNIATSHAHEQFPCKEVSVAIPWPGCIKNVPPIIDLSKKHTKKPGVPASGSPTKKDLPPLPKKSTSPEKPSGSQTDEPPQAPLSESDVSTEASKSPPETTSGSLPDKEGESTNKPQEPSSDKTGESSSEKRGESISDKAGESSSDKAGETTCEKAGETSPDKAAESSSDKAGGTSSNKAGEPSSDKAGEESSTDKAGENKAGEPSSTKPVESSSVSGSQAKSGWSWFDSGSGGQTITASAWGLVILTGGLGGEIKAYQNFGLPVKANRQGNLFNNLAPQK